MQRTKSSAQSTTSKPISITTQFRFQKVDQLTHLLNQVVDGPDYKHNVGDKVLEMLKTQIRTNYDHLYQHYGENKKKILKHIQAVETNIAGENAMNNKFDDLVKEKSKYDKLHAQVGDKQMKLKKLNDIIGKLTEEATGSKVDSAAENISRVGKLEEQKEELEHQAYIVRDMLAVRQKIQMALREKQLRLNEELAHKKEKEARLSKENQKRHQMLKKLNHEIQQSQEVEIPTKLAEELALKMEMYENKHSYNSIIGHEAILQEKKFSKLKEGVRQERQQQRIAKQKKDNEERNQLQQLYNVALIKNLEQEKIKQFCCVSTIQETFDHQKLLSLQNLQKLASEIQAKILEYQTQNHGIEKDIESLIISQSESTNRQGLYEAELALSREEKEKDFLVGSLRKWEALTQNWKIILQLLEIQPTAEGMSAFLAGLETQREKRSLSGSQTNTEHLTHTKIHHFQ